MTEFQCCGLDCRAEGGGDTLVLLFSGFERELFCEAAALLGLPERAGLVLAEFGGIDWDRDYSPWTADVNGRHFSGGADRLTAALPGVTAELERRYGAFRRIYLCGYSLGGLFALYADTAWEDARLCGAGSCSGSMWFPGWTEFLQSRPLRGKVFLSLGGKEKNSPDPIMASVEEKTAEVKRLAEKTAQTTFVHEAGGHFSKVPQRLARAIEWLIKQEQ